MSYVCRCEKNQSPLRLRLHGKAAVNKPQLDKKNYSFMSPIVNPPPDSSVPKACHPNAEDGGKKGWGFFHRQDEYTFMKNKTKPTKQTNKNPGR